MTVPSPAGDPVDMTQRIEQVLLAHYRVRSETVDRRSLDVCRCGAVYPGAGLERHQADVVAALLFGRP